MLPAEQTQPDIARKRERWKRHQDRIDPRRLVFIDETWVKTNMAPLRGWGPRGRRLEAHVPHGQWKTLTFIAALRVDRVDAPWVIDGPINGELFTLYVEKVLAPGTSSAASSHPPDVQAPPDITIDERTECGGATSHGFETKFRSIETGSPARQTETSVPAQRANRDSR